MIRTIIRSFIVAIAALWLLAPAISLASHREDTVNVDAAMKIWVATWQAPLLVGGTGEAIQTTSSAALLGPSLTASVKTSNTEWFNRMYVNLTYLTSGGDFNFTRPSTSSFRSVTADRQDMNLIFGANIYRGFGAYMGYFGSFQNITFTPVVGTRSTANRNFNGFVAGLSASEGISEHVNMYGNVGVSAITQDYKSSTLGTTTVNDSAYGWSSELGLKFHGHIGQKFGVEAGLGMRAQAILTPWKVAGKTVTYNDLTFGPMFTLGGSF